MSFETEREAERMPDGPAGRRDAAAIDAPRVHEALWRIRYAQELADSPLLATTAVAAELARSGLPDTPADRAFALARLLAGLLGAALTLARGADAGAPDPDGDWLAADFAAGDARREALSAVHHRFIATDPVPVALLAARAGVSRRSFERRLARGARILAELLRASEEQAKRAAAADPPPPGTGADPRPPQGAEGGAAQRWEAAAAAWRALLDRGEGLPDGDRAELAPRRHRAPADLSDYRLARVAQATADTARLDARFVPLELVADDASPSAGGRATHASLEAFLAATAATAVVVLGPPGSGKSTLLRRFELDAAVDGLAGRPAPVTLLAALGAYGPDRPGDPPPPPSAWLAAAWARRAPGLPSLAEMLAEGGTVLLLDGLDELPRPARGPGDAAIRRWREWVQELAETATASGRPNRAVFAGRALDYTAPLSRPDAPVPQAFVAPLGDDAARRFVSVYASGAPAAADARQAWLSAAGRAERDALRWPFFLRLFAEQPADAGGPASGRAALLSGAVQRALLRELERGHPAIAGGALLSDADRRRIVAAPEGAPGPGGGLALEGPLVDRLAALGHALHAQATGGGEGRGRASRAEALALLDHPAADEILAAAEALAVLDADAARGEVHFAHRLFQEYFAAQRAAADPAGLARLAAAPWRAPDIRPPLAATIAGLDAGEALPPLPGTGWETVVELAAALADDPRDLVVRLQGANLPLAGRCAALPEVRPRLPDALVADLRGALAARSADPAADLRARIEAARALGELGDPRLRPGRGPDGAFLEGPLARIPAGTVPMGDAEGLGAERAPGAPEDHAPRHEVAVAAFELAVHPVTNAEWRAFVDAGGYDDPRWWPGEAAERWRRGEGTAHAVRANVRLWWHRFRERPGLLDEVRAAGQIDDALHEEWRARLALDEGDLEAYLAERFPGGRKTVPRHWDDPAFNHPAQPVVGVCWFEARAYARWLAAQTGRPYRLPTEAEWELAARGPEGRTYPYGEALDPARCNVRASRVRRPTPVGVYPGGASPEGVEDLTGNVLEWTQSAVRPYPYDPRDGRERGDAPPDVARVLRGGSWINAFLDVRAFVRYPYLPDTRDAVDGLRLACGAERPGATSA